MKKVLTSVLVVGWRVFKNFLRYALAVSLAILAVVGAYKLWDYYMLGPWTRDGRIRTEIIQVSAQVSGRLIRLHVKDNQFVHRGDLLLEIDPEDYELQIAVAESQLGQLLAQKKLAEIRFERCQTLLSSKAISAEEMDIAQADLDGVVNRVRQAETSLEKARLDLSRTKIHAESDGYVTNLNIRTGNLIVSGQALLALVESHSFYAVGYFEETKMSHVEIGRRVQVVPYDGSEILTGRIEGYGRAIVDQSASTGSQLIQNVQANYPWVKLAQRIPVRIAFDPVEEPRPLVAGSTCTILIREDGQDERNALAQEQFSRQER